MVFFGAFPDPGRDSTATGMDVEMKIQNRQTVSKYPKRAENSSRVNDSRRAMLKPSITYRIKQERIRFERHCWQTTI